VAAKRTGWSWGGREADGVVEGWPRSGRGGEKNGVVKGAHRNV